MENRARIAGLAHLQHDLAEVHAHARPERVRRKAGHRQVLAHVARLHGPSFGPEVRQGLLAQEQDGLVRVAAAFSVRQRLKSPCTPSGVTTSSGTGRLGSPRDRPSLGLRLS